LSLTPAIFYNTAAMIEFGVLFLVIFVLLYCLQQRIRKLPLPYYEGRYVIITGCDTGFGNLLAKKLDCKGFSVFAGCLTNNGEEELKKVCSKKLQTFPVDVSDETSVKKAAQFVKSRLPEDAGLSFSISCLIDEIKFMVYLGKFLYN
jgi:hypothetical protein